MAFSVYFGLIFAAWILGGSIERAAKRIADAMEATDEDE